MSAIKDAFLNARSSRRFKRYFFSYIIILFLALLIMGIIVYSGFIKTLQAEIESSNIVVLNQLRDNIDMRLREMERTALDIYTNPNLRTYKFANDAYDIYESLNDLKQYKSGNEFIIDLAMYDVYDSKNKVLFTKTDVSLDIFFKNFYRYENWGKDEFLNLIETLDSPVMRPVESVLEDNVYNRRIATYIYPLPANSKKPQRIVLYFIDEMVLKGFINDILKDYSGFVYILDDNGSPITSMSGSSSLISDNEFFSSLAPGELKQGVSQLKINGEKFSIVKKSSSYNQWSYIIAMPTKQFMDKVYQKQMLFTYAVFIILIIGVIFAYTFAQQNYKPIKNLTDMVLKDKDKNVNAQSFNMKLFDEFHLISSAIQEVVQEKNELMANLHSKSSQLMNQRIVALLKGKINSLKEISSAEDGVSLNLDFPYFAVALFYIDNYLQFTQNNNRQTQALFKYSIINVSEELGGQLGSAYAVELDNERCLAILLNIQKRESAESDIEFFASKIKNFFRENFGFTLTIGIGGIYEDFGCIPRSFTEAEKAVSHRLILGENNIIFYERIKNNNKVEYIYPTKLETRLTMAIKQGKSDEVVFTTGLLMEYLKENEIAPQAAQNICYGLVNSLLKSLNEINIVIEASFDEEWNKLFGNPMETIDDLGVRLIDFGCKICKYIEEQKESKNFELRDKIISIIDNCYCDNTLTLERIVDECGLSQSYICRYFKDQTGYTIMQYVDILRMNKAKEYLLFTDLELRNIIASIGYIDESNFVRKFKKKEGVTPIKFRSISRAKPVDDVAP